MKEIYELLSIGSIDWLAAAFKFGAAAVLPLAIGLERFLRRKPIDFRPFVIISVAACGLLIASIALLDETTDPQGRIDPTRVIQGVISGIGFLGAGAMFREGRFVMGAGSAASIWSAGAIGVMCGLGEIGLAIVVAAIVLVLMVFSEPFTDQWDAHEE